VSTMTRVRGAVGLAGICFDVLGTLFDLEPLLAEIDDTVAPGAGDGFLQRLVPWMWLVTAAERYQPFDQLARAALTATAAEHGVQLDTTTTDLLASRLNRLPLADGAAAALHDLRPAQLAALSNTTDATLRALVDNAGVAQCLLHLLSADQAGRYQPAPQVYALISVAFGVSSDRVLLVSAHDWDIAGAHMAGMRTAWVSLGRPQTPVVGVAADVVVNSLAALPDVLAQRGLIDFEPSGTTIPGHPLPPGAEYTGQDKVSADSFPASDPPAY